jgi:hypothetical protein
MAIIVVMCCVEKDVLCAEDSFSLQFFSSCFGYAWPRSAWRYTLSLLLRIIGMTELLIDMIE